MKYIIPKYIIVLIVAALEKLNVYLVISASNILAINILVICDNTIPTNNPTTNDINPIRKVSKSSIADIFLLNQ